MNYLLDTNILLIYLRSKEKAEEIESQYQLFSAENTPIISIVSIGEILSIAKRNNWGQKKLDLLENIVNSLLTIDISNEQILEKYAQIDAYSQGKLPETPLNTSARNMGKNDLWIAATASVANATLITTDKDFSHLHQVFLKIALLTP